MPEENFNLLVTDLRTEAMSAFDDGNLQPRIAQAATGALDGSPWVEKGRAVELGEAVAELVMIEVATAFADQSNDETDGDWYNRMNGLT
jgi:hypothetical protein